MSARLDPRSEPWFCSAIRAASASQVLVVESVTDLSDQPIGLVALRLDLSIGHAATLSGRVMAHDPAMIAALGPARANIESADPAEAWREVLSWAPGAPLVGRSLARAIGPIEHSLLSEPAVLGELARRGRADLLETVEGMARHGNTRIAALPVRGLWEVAALVGIARPASPGPLEVAGATARVWSMLAPALCEYARRIEGVPAAATGSDPGRLRARLGPGIKAPHASLAGADLHGLNLSRADLSGADLSGVNLSGADLSGADLAGASLSRANLSGANLERADLSHTDLAYADLTGVRLEGARTVGLSIVGLRAMAEVTHKPVRTH